MQWLCRFWYCQELEVSKVALQFLQIGGGIVDQSIPAICRIYNYSLKDFKDSTTHMSRAISLSLYAFPSKSIFPYQYTISFIAATVLLDKRHTYLITLLHHPIKNNYLTPFISLFMYCIVCVCVLINLKLYFF